MMHLISERKGNPAIIRVDDVRSVYIGRHGPDSGPVWWVKGVNDSDNEWEIGPFDAQESAADVVRVIIESIWDFHGLTSKSDPIKAFINTNQWPTKANDESEEAT